MSKLGVLTCGRIGTRGGDLASCLRHLSATISVLERSLRRGGMKRHASERLVAPFLVRSLVEVACTALIGHLDPFRILTLAQVQGRGNYDPSQRTASALKWQGDVLSLDGKSKNPWDSTKKPEQMSRALLGDYQDSIFWQPSFVRFLDHMQTTTAQSQWLSELINTEPTQFVPQLRGKALKLYSTASKGVHHEFVLPLSSFYDNATLEDLTDQAFWLVATMGLVSNFGECTAFAVTPKRAVALFVDLQL